MPKLIDGRDVAIIYSPEEIDILKGIYDKLEKETYVAGLKKKLNGEESELIRDTKELLDNCVIREE